MLNRWYSSYEGVFSVYTHQKLNILIYSQYYHTPAFQSKNIMSQNNQIWTWRSFQLLKKHLQAEPLRANIIVVCFHELTLWHHDLLQLEIDFFFKKYAGLEFRSTFVFISLNWFLQTCGFYKWNKHCEWSCTLVILVHPIEHNCKDSSVTFVSRCWQRDDSDKLNWYSDQEVVAYNKTVHVQ